MDSALHVMLLSLLVMVCGSNAFTTKLIPVDPLHQTNLTQLQRFLQSLQPSNATYNNIGPNVKRAYVDQDAAFYIVEIRIGTPPKFFYLVLDTGSSLTWIQAHNCYHCFYVAGDSYYPEKSSSFSNSGCNDSTCFTKRCNQQSKCAYHVSYADGSHTVGEIGTEIFTFPSKDPKSFETTGKIIFGVGLDNSGSFASLANNRIAGIFALGAGPSSFVRQLGNEGLGLFSYCLPSGNRETGYLKFGEDADFVNKTYVKTTQLLSGPNKDLFYLDCLDMSVAAVRIGLSPLTFTINSDGSGGFIIDSGTRYTVLNSKAYDRLAGALDAFFMRYGIKRLEKEGLCYSRPRGFYNFPYITFHFAHADFDIEPDNGFFYDEEQVCLSFKNGGPKARSILGELSQRDIKILYDVQQNKLSFHRDSCVMGN